MCCGWVCVSVSTFPFSSDTVSAFLLHLQLHLLLDHPVVSVIDVVTFFAPLAPYREPYIAPYLEPTLLLIHLHSHPLLPLPLHLPLDLVIDVVPSQFYIMLNAIRNVLLAPPAAIEKKDDRADNDDD